MIPSGGRRFNFSDLAAPNGPLSEEKLCDGDHIFSSDEARDVKDVGDGSCDHGAMEGWP